VVGEGEGKKGESICINKVEKLKRHSLI